MTRSRDDRTGMLEAVVDAVLLNGTVGAGKSTTAQALSDLLGDAGVAHAVVDVDWIRLLRPAPPGDPFQSAIALVNLRDLARNYRAAGAERLILAGVVETAEDLAATREAVRPSSLLSCRLTVDPATVERRLLRRHEDDARARAWHLDRAPQLAAVLEAAALDDVVLDTTRRDPRALAALVAEAAGW